MVENSDSSKCLGLLSAAACPLISVYLVVFIDRTVHSNHFHSNLLILHTKSPLRDLIHQPLIVCPSLDFFSFRDFGVACGGTMLLYSSPPPLILIPQPADMLVVLQLKEG